MSKFKHFVILFSTLTILIGVMTGCAELVSTETITVDAEISQTYHRAYYVTPMKIGNVTTQITHPASWSTYVMYEGKEYKIGTKEAYNLCKGREGETIKATFNIKTYDDGSIVYNLIDVE